MNYYIYNELYRFLIQCAENTFHIVYKFILFSLLPMLFIIDCICEYNHQLYIINWSSTLLTYSRLQLDLYMICCTINIHYSNICIHVIKPMCLNRIYLNWSFQIYNSKFTESWWLYISSDLIIIRSHAPSLVRRMSSHIQHYDDH